MKIHYMSDLHFEFDPHTVIPTTDADILVLAGDIYCADMRSYQLVSLRAQLRKLSTLYRYIFIVPGNHEYYGSDIANSKPLPKDLKLLNVIELDPNTSIVVDGIKFIGSTMWTNFRVKDPIIMLAVRKALNDYRYIKCNGMTLTPMDTYNLFNETMLAFTEELADYGPTVIITHHAPSFKSVQEEYRMDMSSYGFASHLEEFILEHSNIKAWIHGHVHKARDYLIGDTRVVCNPKGYDQENTWFNPYATIEISA